MTNTPVKNVPVQLDGNVQVDELGHGIFPQEIHFRDTRLNRLLLKNTSLVVMVLRLKI